MSEASTPRKPTGRLVPRDKPSSPRKSKRIRKLTPDEILAAPPEGELPPAGKLEHYGWVVLSRVRYTTIEGAIAEVDEFARDADGDAIPGEPNIIDNIPFKVAESLSEKGVLKPHFC